MGMSPQGFASAYVARIVEQVRRQVEPIFDISVKEAYALLFIEVEQRVRDIFTQEIDNFYSSYSPEYYARTESMYDILEIKRSDKKIVIGFLPEMMTSGGGTLGSGGLYEQTFKKGWHGGAASGPNHPAPGAPFWRTPYGVYKYWGRAAAVSTAPFDEIKSKVEEYGRTVMQERFKTILQDVFSAKIKNIQLKF